MHQGEKGSVENISNLLKNCLILHFFVMISNNK